MKGDIGKLFLDSGAFSLKALADSEKKKMSFRKYRRYMDVYAEFIKEHSIAITVYANVDVLDDPEATYRNQKYLEKKHGLNPIPVVHYNHEEWIDKYLEEGYRYIAFGNLVGKTYLERNQWLNRAFQKVCPKYNDLFPIVKVHGFGLTSCSLILQYPWYSVDSTTASKMAAYGWLLVPTAKSKGGFDYKNYMKIGVSEADSVARTNGIHINYKKASVEAWLNHVGIPVGKVKKTNEGIIPIEEGAICSNSLRIKANLLFFQGLIESLPKWPWQLKSLESELLDPIPDLRR